MTSAQHVALFIAGGTVAVVLGAYVFDPDERARLVAWFRWRARRPRFDSSADFRRQLAIWKGRRP